MTEDELNHYGYLWDGTQHGWVLLRAPHLEGGLCIYNKTRRTLLHIESNDLNLALCERLKQKGVEILDNIPPGDVVVSQKK